jgi:hypothetical protein
LLAGSASGATRLDPCLAARDARWVQTYLSVDRRRIVCEFEAPDADALREALRSADVRFERAWVEGMPRPAQSWRRWRSR